MNEDAKYNEAGTETLSNDFYIVGGTVPSRAPCYIVRQADSDLYTAIRKGQFCYALTARQTGKSSLINHVASRLRAESVTVAQIDLTRIGHNLTIEQWYDGLLYELGRDLGLKAALRSCWRTHSDLGPLHRFLTVLREGVLGQCSGSVVIFVDEIEVVRSLNFSTDEFFAAIRECYNRRASDPDLNRLTFCLVGMASPAELIQDAEITPFNIGTQIDLDDFTLDETAGLAAGLDRHVTKRRSAEDLAPNDGLPALRSHRRQVQAILKRIYYWTNGHPYLTQRLFHAVALDPAARSVADVDRICREVFLSTRAREIDTNLVPVRQYLLRNNTDTTTLLELYGKVRAGKRVVDDRIGPEHCQLRVSGVVRVTQGCLHVRNRIYKQVFGPAWIESNMPGAELRRQKEAFRRGVLRSGVVAGALALLAMGVGTLTYIKQMNQQIRKLDNTVADADVYQAQQSILLHNVSQARELLIRTQNDKGSDFEWRYLCRKCQPPEQHVLSHPGKTIYSAMFSSDGSRLATGRVDGSVQIWNTVTRQEEPVPSGGKTVALPSGSPPEGKSPVVGEASVVTHLWNWQTGAPLAILGSLRASIWSVTMAGGAYRLAVVDESGNRVRVQDLTHPSRPLPTITCGQRVTCVALSLDGRWLATGDWGGDATVWEIATGRARRHFEGNRAIIDTIAFSSDGRQLAIGSYDGTARVWDIATGTPVGLYIGHDRPVTSVAISSDGRRLATGGDDNTVCVWDIATEAALKVFYGYTDAVTTVAFSPDGRQLATGGYDGIVRISDLAPERDTLSLEWRQDKPFNWGKDRQWRGVFSPDGRRLAIRRLGDQQNGDSKNQVQIWDMMQGRWITTSPDPDHPVGTMAFSWDGTRLMIGRSGTKLGIYDALTGAKLTGGLASNLSIRYPLALSPDGRWLAAGDDATVQIWDLRRGVMVRALKGHIWTVIAAAFSPNGTHLATVSADRTALIWDLNGQTPPMPLLKQPRALETVAFSPDGNTLVTGGDDGQLNLWSVATGRETLTLDYQDDLADRRSGSISANRTGRETPMLGYPPYAIRAASFSSDGTLLKAVDATGTIRLWRAATESEIIQKN